MGFKKESIQEEGYYCDYKYSDFILMRILKREFVALNHISDWKVVATPWICRLRRIFRKDKELERRRSSATSSGERRRNGGNYSQSCVFRGLQTLSRACPYEVYTFDGETPLVRLNTLLK